MKLNGTLLAIVAAAAIAGLWPAAGGAATFHGVVVARQHGRLLVASPAGRLRAVEAHAALGSRVALGGRGIAIVGRARTARIRGIVVRRLGSTLILSSNRQLIAIPNRLGRGLAPAPVPGTVVDTTVSIANGEIEEEAEDELGRAAAGSIAVQATIEAVAAGTVSLDVQGQSLMVPLPAGLTLPASLVGQTVTIELSLAGNRDDDDRGDDDGGGDRRGHGGGGDG